MVRIIITGGRDFTDLELLTKSVNAALFNLECNNTITGIGNDSRVNEKDKIEFISGKAKGADETGEKYVADSIYKDNQKYFPAKWDLYGDMAGFIRNEEMAKYACSDNSYPVLIAFWDGKSLGTKHMIMTAFDYGIDTFITYYNNDKDERVIDMKKFEMKKEISVEKLLAEFRGMADRGTLLTGSSVSQEDLYIQISGTITKVAMESDEDGKPSNLY